MAATTNETINKTTNEMTNETPDEADGRLRLVHLTTNDGANGDDADESPIKSFDSFATNIKRGLAATPKYLFPKYFYDELGSLLFDAICLLEEYYLTRAEEQILTMYADDIVRAALASSDGETELALLELGSGSATKTPRIIEAVLRVQSELEFTPVDISASALERSARVLLQSYTNLRVHALAGDYFTALDFLREMKQTNADLRKRRTLALFLGSNIGNFDASGALAFLRRLRATLDVSDALLLGADLRKNRHVLEAAYDDSLGVTAAFNLNILARINRELDADFNPKNFRHIARYDEQAGRMEMFLESLKKQIVRLRKLDVEINFDEGELIHTEDSYKYDLPMLEDMAARTGFRLAQTWLDREELFSSNLFVAVKD